MNTTLVGVGSWGLVVITGIRLGFRTVVKAEFGGMWGTVKSYLGLEIAGVVWMLGLLV